MLIFYIDTFKVNALDKLNAYPIDSNLSTQFTGKIRCQSIGNPGL